MSARPLVLYVAAALVLGSSFAVAAEGQASEKPYTVENGKVDKKTFNGWRRYTESCLRCHVPDGAGSSYGPDLVDSVKHTTQAPLREFVVNSRTNGRAA